MRNNWTTALAREIIQNSHLMMLTIDLNILLIKWLISRAQEVNELNTKTSYRTEIESWKPADIDTE